MRAQSPGVSWAETYEPPIALSACDRDTLTSGAHFLLGGAELRGVLQSLVVISLDLELSTMGDMRQLNPVTHDINKTARAITCDVDPGRLLTVGELQHETNECTVVRYSSSLASKRGETLFHGHLFRLGITITGHTPSSSTAYVAVGDKQVQNDPSCRSRPAICAVHLRQNPDAQRKHNKPEIVFRDFDPLQAR